MALRNRILSLALAGSLAAGVAQAQIPDDIKRALARRDYDQAAAWLGANRSDPDAAFELAKLHRQGAGVEKDERAALELLMFAAAAGHREAQYLVGRHYTQAGELDQAELWMSRAAASGHHRAADWRPPSKTATQLSLPEQIRSGEIPAADTTIADANVADPSGRTPLMLAAGRGALAWVRVLLDSGAAADTSDPHGATALHSAVLGGDAEIVRLLLEAGADPNLADENGNTAMHLAIADESVPVISVLRGSGAEPTLENNAGWTALELARRGDEERVLELFGLHSTSKPSTDLAKLDRESLLRRLSDAALKQDLEKMMALIEQPQFNPRIPELSELLIKLAETGSSRSLRLILQAGVLPDYIDGRGRTALLAAATSAQPSCVEVLVSGGADLSIRDGQGRTALILASKSGSIAAVDTLIGSGSDVSAVDPEDRNALWWASRSGHGLLALHLLNRGALARADFEAVTPLHLAASGNLSDLLEHLAAIEPVDEATIEGQTALMLAAGAGSQQAVTQLVDAGASVSLRNLTGDTALIIATRKAHLEVARVLLENGADPETRNDRFESASSIAMAREDERWQALIEAHSRDVLDLLGAREGTIADDAEVDRMGLALQRDEALVEQHNGAFLMTGRI